MSEAATHGKRGGKRDVANQLSAHRLSVLELVRELDNVTEACGRRGLDRTSF